MSPEAQLTLRRFRLDDAPEVARLVGDESVSRWTANIPHPYTEQDARDWIRATGENSARTPFAVELDGRLVACVSFWPREPEGVEVAYWVGREFWGKGVASRALAMMLAGGEFPQGEDVYARVMIGNTGSEKVLEKCGFVFLGDGGCSRHGSDVPAKVYVRRSSSAGSG